jgi:dihydroorotase
VAGQAKSAEAIAAVMNYLIKDVIWTQKTDPQSGKRFSIRVQSGKITEIGSDLVVEKNELVFEGNGSNMSPGWIDLVARNGAPGHPQNESINSFFNASAAGGFTRVMIMPDTKPIIETIESVSFFKNLKSGNGVSLMVCAAATAVLDGKKMAEILRLQEAGASAFSNISSLDNAGFLSRLLQYMTHGNNLFVEFPSEQSLTKGGQIHDGFVSDNRGLAGIPALAEHLVVDRNLSVLEYSGGRMHFACLSSPESVKKILHKKSELEASCSIASNQLAFNQFAIDQFDTNHKVKPPYREENDRIGLKDLLQIGAIDAVVSNHSPWHYDFKDIEFESAEFGISNLETCFSSVVTFGEMENAEQLVSLFYNGPCSILNQKEAFLDIGMEANFTIFDTQKSWIPKKENWQSKSFNNPFFQTRLKGKVLAIATEKGIFPNPHPVES